MEVKQLNDEKRAMQARHDQEMQRLQTEMKAAEDKAA
jgi:hypothetical protein